MTDLVLSIVNPDGFIQNNDNFKHKEEVCNKLFSLGISK